MRHHPGLHGAEVVICFDGDSAGAAGSARLVELLAERDVPASECRPPDGLDLTTWSAVDASMDGRAAHPARHAAAGPDRPSFHSAGAARRGGGAKHLDRRDRLSVGRTDLR